VTVAEATRLSNAVLNGSGPAERLLALAVKEATANAEAVRLANYVLSGTGLSFGPLLATALLQFDTDPETTRLATAVLNGSGPAERLLALAIIAEVT
jgi:hypothetical protein